MSARQLDLFAGGPSNGNGGGFEIRHSRRTRRSRSIAGSHGLPGIPRNSLDRGSMRFTIPGLYLIVDDIWIPLGESLLIGMFDPVWNKVIDGFGNHDPKKGRYNPQRPPRDVLHPGRPWTEKLRPNPKSADHLCQSILQILENLVRSQRCVTASGILVPKVLRGICHRV